MWKWNEGYEFCIKAALWPTTDKKLEGRIQCWLVLGFQSGACLYLDPSARTRPISLGHNLELDLTSLHGPRPTQKLNPMGFQGFVL